MCPVCSKLISRRFGGTCPRCRPSLMGRQAPGAEGRPLPEGYPAIADIFKLRLPTRKHVPKGAQALFSECLARAANQVCVHNDERAWVEFFLLPK